MHRALDDQPVNTCMVPAAAVHGRRLTTLEGLLGDDLMTRLQRAMVEKGGIQCGYCIAGNADQLLRPAQGKRPTER